MDRHKALWLKALCLSTRGSGDLFMPLIIIAYRSCSESLEAIQGYGNIGDLLRQVSYLLHHMTGG